MERENLKIARIRHFFDFESLNVANHKEEITFFYSGAKTNKLEYFTPQFRHFLKITDYNDEELVFHGELEDYFDVYEENENNHSIESIDEEVIEPAEDTQLDLIIDFPFHRAVESNEFRTITFHDKIDVSKYEGPNRPLFLSIPFDQASHTYVYIKKMPDFKTTIKTIYHDRTTDEFFELQQSRESEYTGEFETTSYYCIFSLDQIPGCDLIVFIEFELKESDKYWFFGGIILGFIVLLFNFVLLWMYPNGSFSYIATISTITITYLIVTKGWIFTKNLDDVVQIFSEPLNRSFSFTKVYLVFIALILIEVLIALLFSCSINANPAVYNVTIQDLEQKIYILLR